MSDSGGDSGSGSGSSSRRRVRVVRWGVAEEHRVNELFYSLAPKHSSLARLRRRRRRHLGDEEEEEEASLGYVGSRRRRRQLNNVFAHLSDSDFCTSASEVESEDEPVVTFEWKASFVKAGYDFFHRADSVRLAGDDPKKIKAAERALKRRRKQRRERLARRHRKVLQPSGKQVDLFEDVSSDDEAEVEQQQEEEEEVKRQATSKKKKNKNKSKNKMINKKALNDAEKEVKMEEWTIVDGPASSSFDSEEEVEAVIEEGVVLVERVPALKNSNNNSSTSPTSLSPKTIRKMCAKRFLNVERSVRSHLRKMHNSALLERFEEAIVQFVMHGRVRSFSDADTAHAWVSPEGDLVLGADSFFRMLVYGLCQFHGLRHTTRHLTTTNERVVVVLRPTALAQEPLRLCQHLRDIHNNNSGIKR